MHVKFWSENLKRGGHLVDERVDGKIILQLTVYNITVKRKRKNAKIVTGLVWLRIRRSGKPCK